MWQPLLEGNDRQRAADALAAITADLVALTVDWDGACPDAPPNGLCSGRVGVAVFLSYYARTTGRAREASAAVALLEESILDAMRRPPGVSLCDGLVGLAWAVSHVCDTVLPNQDDDPVAAVDSAIAALLDDGEREVDGELLYGLSGYGIYALERLRRPASVRILERIVERLVQSAESLDGGVAWRVDPGWLTLQARAEHPEGRVDLGVAHGVAGIIGFLARVAAAGVSEVSARGVLEPAVDWLLAQRTDGYGRTTVPPFLGFDLRERRARTAWCYGDLGVAAALLAAARHAHRTDWEVEATTMARVSAVRPENQMHLFGTGLCHGMAGAAHLYGRMYQTTGDPELRHAATRWFRRVLDERQPGMGVGGFGAHRAEPQGTLRWWGDPGLLNGAAGVGLALLSALEAIEPEWDRILAIATPAGG